MQVSTFHSCGSLNSLCTTYIITVFFRLIFYSFFVFDVYNSEMFMADLLNMNYICDAFSVDVGE